MSENGDRSEGMLEFDFMGARDFGSCPDSAGLVCKAHRDGNEISCTDGAEWIAFLGIE